MGVPWGTLVKPRAPFAVGDIVEYIGAGVWNSMVNRYPYVNRGEVTAVHQSATNWRATVIWGCAKDHHPGYRCRKRAHSYKAANLRKLGVSDGV